MINLALRAVPIFAVMATLAAAAQESVPDPGAQVIARVGDEVITAGDYSRELQLRVREIQVATGRAAAPDANFRRAVMQDLINGHVLSVAARNAGVAISDEDLNKEFDERKAAFKSEAAYQEYLKRLGMDEAALKDNMRSRLRVTRFVDQQIGEVNVTDEDIQTTYDTMKADGVMTRTEKTRDVAMILLRPKGDSDEDWRAAEERAKAVHGRLDAGEDFEKVAEEVSDENISASRGGVIREMKFGSFHPELETAMDALAPGAFSDPVRSVAGWYIVKVLQVNEPGTIPLDAVRDAMAREFKDKVRKQKIAEIVAETQKLIRIELVMAQGEGDAAADSGQ